MGSFGNREALRYPGIGDEDAMVMFYGLRAAGAGGFGRREGWVECVRGRRLIDTFSFLFFSFSFFCVCVCVVRWIVYSKYNM